LRRWLLALVCLLLIADGYWASRNLVFKNADSGIYWVPLHPNLEIYVGNDASLPNRDPPATELKLLWSNGKWLVDGKPVADINNYIQYYHGYHGGCGFAYQLDGDPTADNVFKSVEEALSTGAGSTVVLAPRIEADGKTMDSVPVFEVRNWTEKTCPFSKQWRKSLSYGESGVGYPPNLKSRD
jgi:hypothetical protein